MKVISRSEEYPRSSIKIAVHNLLWMYPFTLLPVSRQLHGHHEGERWSGISTHMMRSKREVAYCMGLLGHHLPLRYNNDPFLAAYVVIAEAILMGVWGLPDFPERAYGICFTCCVTIFFSSQFLVSVFTSKSLVSFFPRLLAAPIMAYDRIWRSGRWGIGLLRAEV